MGKKNGKKFFFWKLHNEKKKNSQKNISKKISIFIFLEENI